MVTPKSHFINKNDISIKDYGAVGDGITNDLPAIQTALTQGDAVYFPSGTYLSGSNVTLGSPGQVIFFEPGAKLHIPSGITVTISGQIEASTFQQIFQVDSGGSLQFSLAGTGPDIAHVCWFGADRTGSFDSSAAVKLAIAALPDIGGTVEFPAGYFLLTNILINSKNGVKFRGAQRFATTIIDTSATANLFSFSSCGLIDIEDFEIRRPSLSDIKTSGVTFDLNNVSTSDIRNCRIDQPYQGFHIYNGSGGVHLNNIKFLPGSTSMNWDYGIKCENSAGIWMTSVDCNMGNNVSVLSALLVLDGGCDTIIVTDCGFGQVNTNIGNYGDPYPSTGGTCVKLQNTNASFDPRWVHFNNIITEAINGVGIDISAVNQLSCFGCTVQTSLVGIRVTGGNDISFVKSFVNQIQQHGISITGGSRIWYTHGEVTGCSRELTNTYSGFSIGGTAQDIHIEHCSIGDIDTLGIPPYSMLYGISQAAGGSDNDANHKFQNNVYGYLASTSVFRGVQKTEYGTRFDAENTLGTAPTEGTWTRGDKVRNLNAADGYASDFICITSGTPGNWASIYAHTVAPTSSATLNAPVIRDSSGGDSFVYVTATQGISNPASVGAIRLPQTASVVVRNKNNNGDYVVLTGDGNDNYFYGAQNASSGLLNAVVGGDTTARLRVNGSDAIVALGSNFAASGIIRVPKAGSTIIAIPKSGGGGDVAGLTADGIDNLILGDSTGTTATTVIDGKNVRLRDPVQSTALQVNSNNNISLFFTGSFGGGQGVLSIRQAVADPTTNPTTSGILYAKTADGSLMYRTPGGGLFALAPTPSTLGNVDSTFNPGTSTFWALPSTTTITADRTYTAGITGVSTGTTGNINGLGTGDSRTMFVDIYNAAAHAVAIVNGGTSGGTLITLSNATNAHIELLYDTVSGDWTVARWWLL